MERWKLPEEMKRLRQQREQRAPTDMEEKHSTAVAGPQLHKLR